MLLPDRNLTICLHMRDYGHLTSLSFLQSYLRHFCLLGFSFTLLLEITQCLESWSSALALDFRHPQCRMIQNTNLCRIGIWG